MAGSLWVGHIDASHPSALDPTADAANSKLSRSRWWLALAVAGLWGALLLPGCDDAAAPTNPPCVDGATLPCSCDDGAKGTQTCATGAFGACSCTSGQDAAGDSEALDSTTGSDETATSDAAEPSDSEAETDAVASSDTAADTDAAASSDTAAGTDAATGPATCASDKDCKDAGKVCDPLTNQCVACLSDAECGPSQHCVGLVCQTYTACTNSLGCKSAKGPDGNDQPICDQGIGECSACLTAADCPASHDCIAKACVPFATCQNSTDCGKDEVCNKATSRCVQCLGNNDCSATQLCEAGQCRDFVPCSSDKQCTDKGLLCDQAKAKCAQCLENSDCPDIYHCQKVGVDQTGLCVLDVCAQGQGACSNNAKVTCNAVGDGFGAPVACPAQSTCVAPGGKPECKAWVCSPGASCDGNKALECSGDGLEVLKSTDCAANSNYCFKGACQPTLCEAGQVYCDGQTKKVCSLDGLSVVESQPCGGGTFCDAGQCKPQVCAPGSAVCNGNTATLCNDTGSGFASGGTPCGTELCVQGACKPFVCEPNAKFCEANVPKVCSADGMTASGTQACFAGTFCHAGQCLPSECMVCGGSYPGCAQMNGSWKCVECTADTECQAKGKGTCNVTTYTCSGSIGPTAGPDTGLCLSDADCPPHPNGTFSLKCDLGTGLCYDVDGRCDNVTAYCNVGQGSNCRLTGDLLAGTSGAPVGSSAPEPNLGQCTCPVGPPVSSTPSIKPECSAVASLLPNLKNCDCVVDPNSSNCKDLLGLGSCCTNATGGGGNLPFDPSCLAQLTGGQSTGLATPACFGTIQCSEGLQCLYDAFGGGQTVSTWTCGTAAIVP